MWEQTVGGSRVGGQQEGERYKQAGSTARLAQSVTMGSRGGEGSKMRMGLVDQRALQHQREQPNCLRLFGLP